MEKLHIYPASRSVYKNDQEVELTKMEFDVLYFLASNQFPSSRIRDITYTGFRGIHSTEPLVLQGFLPFFG